MTNLNFENLKIDYLSLNLQFNNIEQIDIEFVKQSIGHQKLDTTSAYVNKLSDQKRQKRIDQLK